MAGGVALNCVANGKILAEKIFDNVWIQPAAGDAGGSIGAALYLYHEILHNERKVSDGYNNFLGPEFSNEQIENVLKTGGFVYHRVENISELAAKLLNTQKVIGLFSGRMEFGPRALGARSIIADARSKEMQSRLNLKIKFRESFRPFAPAVLLERLSDYFEMTSESPFMLFCAPVKKNRRLPFSLEDLFSNGADLIDAVNLPRSDIPAVTHVDYSARIQTVSKSTNPWLYDILKTFEKLTGCGVIVNTSLNVRGEPIVCTPEDAVRCFSRADMDALLIGNFVLYKAENPSHEVFDWRKYYESD